MSAPVLDTGQEYVDRQASGTSAAWTHVWVCLHMDTRVHTLAGEPSRQVSRLEKSEYEERKSERRGEPWEKKED